MLGADNLFLLERELDNLNSLKDDNEDKKHFKKLKIVLDLVYNLKEYQDWLAKDQFFQKGVIRSRFSLPKSFGVDMDKDDKWLLEYFGLLNGGLLEVKITSNGNEIHLTDGSWVSPDIRVYPFTDESELLCKYYTDEIKEEFDLLIDPACGCGRHSLGIADDDIPVKISFDINLRALAYCRINALLSNKQEMLCGINDLRDGLPSSIQLIAAKNVLITINMPFGIFPQEDDSTPSLAQDGGDRGVALTFSALEAVLKLSKNTKMENIRTIILFYSLGNKETDQWEVVNRAIELFGQDNISFKIFENEKMWRINGKKEQPNPMPIDNLALKANCKHTFNSDEADIARKGYQRLQALYKEHGYTHLAYGLLDICCKSPDSSNRKKFTLFKKYFI